MHSDGLALTVANRPRAVDHESLPIQSSLCRKKCNHKQSKTPAFRV